MSDDNKPTYMQVADGMAPYWQDWAVMARSTVKGNLIKSNLIRTVRTGSDGRSDAQYIVDRLASGFHFAKIVDPSEEGYEDRGAVAA
jgi:hypothetical protein